MKKMIMILGLLTILSIIYATIDLGVTEILPGTIYYGTSAKIFPNIKIHNYGDEVANNFDVVVIINNGSEEIYNFTNNITEELAAGEETFVTMNNLWIIEDPSFNFEITVNVIIDNDTNPANDELSVDCDIVQLDYTEDAYALRYVFYQDKTFGSLDLESGDYSIISDVSLTLALKARGADFANGVMYGVVSTYGGAYPRELHIMQPDGQDINLGDITSEDFLDNEYISGITYDYDNHIFYIITTCWGDLTPRLYTVNQFTLEAKFIGQMNDLQFMSIEYAEGVLYGLEVQQLDLHQIDMETAEATVIGDLGVSYVALDQCLSYDASSGTMYGTFYNDITGSSFRTVNLETGNTTQIQGYDDTFNLIYFAINTDPIPSFENNILSFLIPEQVGETIFDVFNHTVLVCMPEGTNVTALIPEIEISEFATIDPESGTPQDFTDPVEYTVTAENGDEQIWLVTVALLVSSEDHLTLSTTKLIGNYPNPFNPTTTITFHISSEQNEQIELNIYNLKGQKVKTFPVILSGVEGQGEKQHNVTWNGTDDNNQPVSSGVYLYKLQSGEFSQMKKMILMK